MKRAAVRVIKGAGLIFEETFEGLQYFPVNQDEKPTSNTVHAIENNGSADALSFPVYAGTKTARFRLSKDEPLFQGETYRTEVTIVKAEDDSRVTANSWYGFKILFPKAGGEPDTRKSSINQWFEDGGNELTLRTMNGAAFMELETGTSVYQWDLYSDKAGMEADNVAATFAKHPLEEWAQFTFNIIHKLDASGFIKIYRNGVLIHEYSGPTIHLKIPKWKMGIYSSFTKSILPFKIVYFDDVRVGNDQSNLQEMLGAAPISEALTVLADNDFVVEAPIKTAVFQTIIGGMAKAGIYNVKVTATGPDSATATDEMKIAVKPVEVIPPEPPEPTGDPIQEFILIDAGLDSEIGPMAEGGSYKIPASKKLNIKVNVTAEVAKVGFVCTGPTGKSSTDKGAPFSLHGDTGTSPVNYYYGNWGPPGAGAYKLVATPYNAAGTALASKTINFSFTA